VLREISLGRSNAPSDRPRVSIAWSVVPVRPDDALRSPVCVFRWPLVGSRLAGTGRPSQGKQSLHRLRRGHHDSHVADDSPLWPSPRVHRRVSPTRRTTAAVFLAGPACSRHWTNVCYPLHGDWAEPLCW